MSVSLSESIVAEVPSPIRPIFEMILFFVTQSFVQIVRVIVFCGFVALF